jgi:phage terminase Nu1 subunit (DNA packaging protein)
MALLGGSGEKKRKTAKRYARSIPDIADALDVTERTVRNWLADGAPGKERGRYDIEAIDAWRAANTRGGAKRSGAWQDELSQAEAEKARHEARIAKMKADKMAGIVTDTQSVELDAAEMCTLIRVRLQQLPEEVSYLRCDPEEIPHALRERIDYVLTSMASSDYHRHFVKHRIAFIEVAIDQVVADMLAASPVAERVDVERRLKKAIDDFRRRIEDASGAIINDMVKHDDKGIHDGG